MSMRQVINKRHDGLYLLPFSLLVGFLLLSQVWSPNHALAAAHVRYTAPSVQTSVQRSGVSVVRLVVSYHIQDTRNNNQSMQCTGLGEIIASNPANNNNTTNTTAPYKNWILTDGALVDSTGSPFCLNLSSSTKASLVSIAVYTSKDYSSSSIAFIGDTTTIQCLPDRANCSKELVVFALDSTNTAVNNPAATLPLPVIQANSVAGVATSSSLASSTPTPASLTPTPDVSPQQALFLASAQNVPLDISLANNKNSANGGQYITNLQQYLFPIKQAVPNTTNSAGQSSSAGTPTATGTATLSMQNLEPGTPFVDNNGYFTGILLEDNGGMTPYTTIINTIESARVNGLQTGYTNTVTGRWQNGINAYHQGNFTQANADFQSVFSTNRSFQGAQQMATFSSQAAGSSGSNGQREGGPSTPSSSAESTSFLAYLRAHWQPALIVLAIILVLVLLAFFLTRARVRRRRHQHALKVEMAEADKQASLEASRIKQMEAAQPISVHTDTGYLVASSTGTLPQQHAQATLPCPNCHEPVAVDATYCPSCKQLLSASESGYHMRMPVGQSSFPNVQPVPMSSMPPAAHFQPTSTPPMADQPTIVPPPPPLSIAEQPTHQIEPQGEKQDVEDVEKTIPFALRQVNKQHFGLLVGTQTNPGIKRKYKPNEDSLFAAQGMLPVSQHPQNFGLFVIADGMGGHANGKDASRLAIQTIINHLLPELSQTNQPLPVQSGPDQYYAQLLTSGIQEANLAVHKHNMEQRADMGTTVTAALVIDATAYVANVGDSRTYLYRPGIGLRKVTNDHSVVASLVEAGIIQPDDIYTHPKRNQIYRSLGEKPDVEIDSFTVQLQVGDKLLLCSDGLWDMVRDPKIEALISAPAPDPDMTGQALIQAALDGGGEDNVSVIVVHVTDSGTNMATMSRIQLLAKPETVQMPQLS